MQSFASRLAEAVRRTGTAAMVGLDPRWESLPDELKSAAGTDRRAAVAGAYRDFCRTVIDGVAGLVPIVKFQAAFFEAVGPAGMVALADAMQHAVDAGLLVILDGKRNDIGSTAQAYAEAYLGGSAAPTWPAHSLTVNPYLGLEGIEPFAKAAAQAGTGVFVLVRTSNPGAGALQDASLGERTVYQLVADWVEQYSRQYAALDGGGYGPLGAVVGATVPAQLAEARTRMPHAWLLVPGYGAQGGTSADVAAAFDDHGLGAIVNNSRGILFAFREPAYAHLPWRATFAAATHAMIADLAAHTPAGCLR